MAHKEQYEFVEKLRSNFGFYFARKKVLEVGSLDINGSLRHFFMECDYTGIDLAQGPCVDIVCSGHEFNAPGQSYDTVFSSECFEHNPYWIETFKNMVRLCKNSGLIFITCATEGRKEHGTRNSEPGNSPFTVNLGWDYYKNLSENDFRQNIDLDNLFNYYGFEVDHRNHDLYFYGIKATQNLQ